jgi:DHA3 family macrolide efflux protein-like MFS transporter
MEGVQPAIFLFLRDNDLGDMNAAMQSTQNKPGGMLGFTIVWAGQLVSVLASSMTQFALTIWAFRETGSATALGIVSTAFIVPFLLLSPIAGVMVDRYNRKLMMMVSDLAAVSATVGLLIINSLGSLQMWHLYVAAVINGLGNTFQWPAYSAAISTMVSKENYSRANGMMSLVESGPGVLAPMLAGILLPIIKLSGILTLDVITFFLAIFALLWVRVPPPVKTVEGQAGQGSLWKEAIFGFKYIFARRSLLGLLIFFICLNFTIGMSISLFSPYILSRTGNNSTILGLVESTAAIGAVLGGLLIGLWGGFKRRMTSIFIGEALTGLFCLVVFGLGRIVPIWILATVAGSIFPVFTNGASQAIWQAKVAPDVQGRVFSARRMIAWAVNPITPILAGVLADYMTEPAMLSNTWLSKSFSWLVGAEPGSGMALQFVITGIAYMVIVLITYLFVPVVRNLEDLLPDHDQMEKIE